MKFDILWFNSDKIEIKFDKISSNLIKFYPIIFFSESRFLDQKLVLSSAWMVLPETNYFLAFEIF